jgi:uncharacterized protein (DUF2252 family)
VGGVGIHTTVILLTSDSSESLVLQVKEARRSVLEPYVGRSHYSHSGQRVVEGQRLMQASSDILLGWMRGPGLYGVVHDYYVRQLWDRKISPDFAAMNSEDLQLFGRACAWTLARAHARSGDRIAIASYLGVTEHLPDAIDQFAVAYADQTERDFSAFVDAADRGRIFTATDLS